MDTINTPSRVRKAPVVDFTWSPVGGSVSYDIGGNHYPYAHQVDAVTRASDSRYPIVSTPYGILITFVPVIALPSGGTILSHTWDFGDGALGYGPSVTHTFGVNDPAISVTLTVIDSFFNRVVRTKPMVLGDVDLIVVLSDTVV